MDRRPFEALIGVPLWLVGFAPEDVHLRFGGPEGLELRARHAPMIETDAGDVFEPCGPDYEDALCGSLGDEFRDGYWVADETVLSFEKRTLRLSLRDETDGVAPEVAELHSDGLWLFGPEFFEAS